MAETIDTTINGKQLSEVLGVTIQLVYRLSNRGVLSSPTDGRWPFPKVVHEFIDYKSKKPSENKSLTEERLRRERIRADRDQLALDRELGELIPTELAQKAWAKVLQNFVNKLDAVPSKLAPMVQGMSIPEAKTTIDRMIYEVKNELADTDLKELAKSTGRKPSSKRTVKPGKAKAAVKRKRVGGSKSDAKPGGKRGARKVVHVKG